ncbi:MAG: NAD(P)H-dependent oxidoreductase [Campylobacter sp.]|nr:NAD(P)H-dependent oxidoreductase [Campylobacter sp.]
MKNLIILAEQNNKICKAWRDEALNQGKFELYELCDNYQIDAKSQQNKLENFDNIIIMYPLCLYSYPAILSKWFNEVFKPEWLAKKTLLGKRFCLAISVGEAKSAFLASGIVGISINEILKPFQALLNSIGASNVPNFIAYDLTNDSDDESVNESVKDFAEFLQRF